MAILVVTNRNIANRNREGADLFGDRVNDKGPGEIRLAWAERRRGGWNLDLIPEPDRLRENNRPSRQVFAACRESLSTTGRHCLFYVHGYNQAFSDSLNQAHDLRERYGIAVVLFSWPSNPGGFFLSEYEQARSIAKISATALARTLDLLARYFRAADVEGCTTSFNFIAHSLGNLLFEEFVRIPIFPARTRIFDNVVLHQADVDLDGHAQWITRVRVGGRVYVTINERDKILDLSDIINPDRLGNTVRDLAAERTVYVDFTDTPEVGTTHRLVIEAARANTAVATFFDSVLKGGRPERSAILNYEPRFNTHTVV